MSTDVENLRIQQQINQVLVERSRMLDAQASRLADQTELALQLCKALKCEEVDKTLERVNQLREALKAAGDSANNSMGALSTAAIDAQKELKRLEEERINSIEKSLKDLGEIAGSVLSGTINSAKALGSAFFDAVQFVSNLTIAILGIPLKIFDIMTSKAAELAGDTSVFDAMERVREQFGDISEGFGKRVVDGAKGIKKSLGEAGLSVARVFGTGPGGVAASIDASNELAQALGDSIYMLGESFDKVAGPLFVLQKGLGIANEELKGLVIASRLAGRETTDVLRDIEKLSTSMSKKFGMSSKMVARDMAYMLSNTAKYGKISAAQVAATVVYVKKLGLEVKNIEGLVNAFDDFETAATNASKLAQAFGLQVDAMRMMKEQDPGKRLEMLRSAFAATGKSIDQMTRQEKQLLATTAGLDEGIVEQALSAKNMGKSYQQLQNEADITAKKQKSQQEMFEDLGNAIKRVTESLDYSGGLLANFFKGFGEGLARSKNGRTILYDLVKLLRGMRTLGREVGAVFANAFPGMRQMFDGLHEILSGKDGIATLVSNLSGEFQKFFKTLETNPTKAVGDFIDGIQSAIMGTGGGSKLLAGFRQFTTAVSSIIGGIIDNIAPKIADVINKLANAIKDPQGLKAGFSKLASGTNSMLKPIFDAIIRQAPLLWESLKNLFNETWNKYGDDITKFVGDFIFAALFLNALKYVFLQLPGRIATLFIDMISEALGGTRGASAINTLARFFSRAGVQAVSKALVVIGAAVAAADIDKLVGDILEEKLSSGEIENAGAAAGGKIVASLVNFLSLGLLSDETYKDVALATADMLDSALSWIEKTFGPATSEWLGGLFKGVFNSFSGFGDFLIGVFTGDFDRLYDGIQKLGEGIAETLMEATLGSLALGFDLILKLGKSLTEIGPMLEKLWNEIDFSNLWDQFIKAGLKWKSSGPWTKIEVLIGEIARSIAKRMLNSIKETFGSLEDATKNHPIIGPLIEFLTETSELVIPPNKNKASTQAIVNSVTPDPDAIRDSLESSAEEIKGIALENLNDLGDSVTQYQNLTPEKIKKTQENLNASLRNMQDIISGIDNQALTNMRNSFAKLDTGAISLFEGLMTKINESFDISKLAEIDAKLMVIDERIITRLQTIMNRSLAVGALAEEFKTKYSGGLVSYIESTAAELEELDALLSDIKIASIDNTIDSLNNKLLVNNKKINIENKPINIHLNLGVSFKAEDFTKNIFAVAGKLVKTGNTTLTKFTSDTFDEAVKSGQMKAD